jgi:hypothetical protein
VRLVLVQKAVTSQYPEADSYPCIYVCLFPAFGHDGSMLVTKKERLNNGVIFFLQNKDESEQTDRQIGRRRLRRREKLVHVQDQGSISIMYPRKAPGTWHGPLGSFGFRFWDDGD